MILPNESLVNTVLTAATNVHARLGPGLLEAIYERALVIELDLFKIDVVRQVPIEVKYRERSLGLGFRADLIVANSLLIELKTVEKIIPIHIAQVITYLKLLNFKRGYLLNFNVPLMKQGIRRISI